MFSPPLCIACRASCNRGLGLALHWLLYTEWEDPVFGPRVQHTHVAFQAAAESAQVLRCASGCAKDEQRFAASCHDAPHDWNPRCVLYRFQTVLQSTVSCTVQMGVLDDISKQMGLWAQLRHIAGELRAIRGGGAARKASALRAMLRCPGILSMSAQRLHVSYQRAGHDCVVS
jgi:hypothetical protein